MLEGVDFVVGEAPDFEDGGVGALAHFFEYFKIGYTHFIINFIIFNCLTHQAIFVCFPAFFTLLSSYSASATYLLPKTLNPSSN